jgi:hypothetical protein
VRGNRPDDEINVVVLGVTAHHLQRDLGIFLVVLLEDHDLPARNLPTSLFDGQVKTLLDGLAIHGKYLGKW